jgi:hypothetical protein
MVVRRPLCHYDPVSADVWTIVQIAVVGNSIPL